jgi:type II secretory pathway component GspD/PulD (secretin)
MSGTADDIARAQKIIADLDRPRKIYRLTYSVTDTGDNQPPVTRHYTLVTASGDRTTFKQGDRVPIITGRTGDNNPTETNTQVQYQDVGLNIEVNLANSADALTLRSRVEISAVTNPASGASDPNIRQTVLQGTSALQPGKPLVLGSTDVPGTSRHEEIEVVAELVR